MHPSHTHRHRHTHTHTHTHTCCNSDRHEPDDENEVNFPFLFREMERVYNGFIGCEYAPREPAQPSFSWLKSATGHEEQ